MSLSHEFGKLKLQDSYARSENDIIVAIDFGTSRTGVVWGLRKSIPMEDLEVQPLDGSGVLHENDKKTLTAILLNRKDGHQPIAFGQKAREYYTDDEYNEDYFFRYFKMNLHKQFQIDPDVFAANNKTLPLSLIIQKSFELIKNKMTNALHNRGILMSKDPYDIVWALTVPAIWTDVAKHIMRRAAFRAGMIKPETSDRLIIALEPECAFIGAMRIFKQNKSIYTANKKFLIVDCGGGTIDITGHEIISIDPLSVSEIICPDGGHLGSTLIDQNFFEFLKEFLGELKYNEISCMQEFVELEKLWEECKLGFPFDRNAAEITRMNLATVCYGFSKEEIQQCVEEWNLKYPDKYIRKFGTRIIGLSYDLMMSFYEKPIEDIIRKVDDVISSNQSKLSNLDFIILAGGFCKNRYFIKRMNEVFHDQKKITVLLGKEPDLLIVKGAAIFGCDPNAIIKTRKAKYTFGVDATIIFDPRDKVHKKYKNLKYRGRDGKDRLDVIVVHGRIGDDIKVGAAVPRKKLYPVTSEQRDISMNVYISNQPDPFHITEDGNKQLAQVCVPLDMDAPYNDRGINVEFSFASTEVNCSIYSLSGEFLNRIVLDYSKFFG